MSGPEPVGGLQLRIYRALVLAYPPSFRRRFGDEMVEAFEHRWRVERRASRRWPAARVWALVLRDWLTTVPAEWFAAPPAGGPTGRRVGPTRPGDGVLVDLRVAARGLRRRPGFALVATLTLALGIGANAAAFSVVRHVVVTPLPVADPDRVFYLVLQHAELGFQRGPDAETIETLEERSSLWTGIAAYGGGEAVRTDGAGTRVTTVTRMSGDLMALLGIRPLLGRAFVAEDTTGATPAVAVVSERLWRAELGGEPGALGTTIVVDDTTRTIVGVRPTGVNLAWAESDIWLPVAESEYTPQVIGRLAPGVSPDRARTELEAIRASATTASEADDDGPFAARRWVARLLSPRDIVQGGLRRGLLIVFAAIGMVLLIACANVSNMLLARGLGREGELQVRRALGASRWRLVRLFLTESLWLTAAGGLLGLGIARLLLLGMRTMRPDDMRAFDAAGLDPATLAFVLSVSALAVLAASALPAIHLTGTRGSRRRVGGSGARVVGVTRSSRVLIGIQVALTVVLLTGAGLLIRTFDELRTVETGVDLSRLASFGIHLPEGRYPTPESRFAFFERLERELEADPAIEGVAIGTGAPLRYSLRLSPPLLDGDDPDDRGESSSTLSVTPDYFEVAGMRWIRGRTFAPTDGPLVVVVNEAFARRYGDPGDVIGRRFRFDADEEWRTIIGVVRNVKSMGLRDDPSRVQVYYPLEDLAAGAGYVIARGRAAADPLLETVRTTLRGMDPLLPLRDLATGGELRADLMVRDRFLSTALAGFAALALILSCVGIYGVVSLAVRRRLPELGVRVALGATGLSLVATMANRESRPVLVGVGVGVIAALGLSRLLRGILFGISPNDPVTLVTACVLFLAVATVACVVPARRAAAVDPVTTMRSD